MPSDWPQKESETLWQSLQGLRQKHGYDVISETFVAVLSRPIAEVRQKGGPLRYFLGILSNKIADTYRKRTREQHRGSQLRDVATAQAERTLSETFRRSSDECEPADESHLAPREARSPEAALAECDVRLGKERCKAAISLLKQVLRRQGYLSEAPERLQPFVALLPIVDALRKARKAHPKISAGVNSAEDYLPKDPSAARRELIEDAYDVPQFPKAQNLCRNLEAWIQSEQFSQWMSAGMKLIAEAVNLLAEVKATEVDAVAKRLVSIESQTDRPLFTQRTTALLEIAAGLESPPKSKSAWKTLCGKWKKALQRARTEQRERGHVAEKRDACPP